MSFVGRSGLVNYHGPRPARSGRTADRAGLRRYSTSPHRAVGAVSYRIAASCISQTNGMRRAMPDREGAGPISRRAADDMENLCAPPFWTKLILSSCVTMHRRRRSGSNYVRRMQERGRWLAGELLGPTQNKWLRLFQPDMKISRQAGQHRRATPPIVDVAILMTNGNKCRRASAGRKVYRTAPIHRLLE